MGCPNAPNQAPVKICEAPKTRTSLQPVWLRTVVIFDAAMTSYEHAESGGVPNPMTQKKQPNIWEYCDNTEINVRRCGPNWTSPTMQEQNCFAVKAPKNRIGILQQHVPGTIQFYYWLAEYFTRFLNRYRPDFCTLTISLDRLTAVEVTRKHAEII